MKKNYYRLALLHHPDRVADDHKAIAKDKFSIIHQAYLILADDEKRTQYDNGCDVFFAKATKVSDWEQCLKPTTKSTIESARAKYINSPAEISDVRREFEAGRGSMTHLLNTVPFMRHEDEQRIMEIVKTLMAESQITKYKIKKIPRK